MYPIKFPSLAEVRQSRVGSSNLPLLTCFEIIMKQFKYILLFFFIGFVSPDFCFSRNVIGAKDMYELMEKVEKDIGWLSSNGHFAVSVQHKRKRYVPKRSCRKIYSSDTIYAVFVCPIFELQRSRCQSYG